LELISKQIKYLCIINVFFLNTLFLYAQSSPTLQAGIFSNSANNRFCKGTLELFQLDGRASGGIEPYFYEWTFTWNKDTLNSKTINIQPDTSGEVKLKVTDSSFPAKSKDAIYQIKEIILNADFTIDAGTSCAQVPIKFTPVVTGGTPVLSYFWDFGDFYSSLEKNPAHEFIASGCSGTSSFNVSLVVTDADGCSVSVNKTVTVKNKPFLNFIDTENPFTPFKHCPEILIDPTFDIVLDNKSLNTSCIASYKIDWGDGSSVVNDASFPIRHTYTKAGAFELRITAGNINGCDLVWTQFVYNQSSPAAGIESYGGTEGCAPIEFAFGLIGYENNSIGTTYTWDFGDGSPVIVWDHSAPFINDSIKHVYLKTSCDNGSGPGYFSTYVTVKNGCDTKTATVDKVRIWSKPEASIDDGALTIDTICVNETIQLNNNSKNGSYGSNCTRLSQYEWDFGNGINSVEEQMPPMSWSVPGEYDIVLKVKNPCGETQDTFKIVVIKPPVANAIVEDTAGCAPFKPELKNNSTGSKKYLWKIKPNSGYSFLNGTSEKSLEPEISFNEAGSYHVVLYASNECQTDSVLFNFNVFTKPDGSIENPVNLCITDPVIHPSVVYKDNGSPVTAFNWTFPGGNPIIASAEDPGEHTYASAGEYTINLVLENACGSRNLENTFYVHAKPEVTVNTPVSICESDSIIVTGTAIANVTSFKWQTLGDGYFTDNSLLNPVYYPGPNDLIKSGTSLLIVAAGASPCNSDTAVLILTIQKKPWVKPDNNVTICEGNAYNIINTTAGNYDVIHWSTSGDGYFSDPAILLPVYYPGSNDISGGRVELSLTAQAIDPCLLNASGNFVITYARVPTLDAGPDRDICKNGQVSLSASGTGLTSVAWHVENGEGSFSNPSGLDPVFTLSPGFSGSHIFVTVEATGGYGCNKVYDTLELKVIPFPIVFAGDDAIVCESGSLEIKGASALEYFDFAWTVNGDGTLNDNSVLNPVYTPGASDIINGKVIITLNAKGKSVCPDVSDAITISIQKLPVSNAGEDQEVCKSNSYLTTGGQENGASYQWTTLGTGTFEDETKLITAYYPSAADKDKGSVELVLKVNAIAPCLSPDSDTVKLTFIDPPVLSAGNDTTICSSSFKPGNAYSINSTQYEWSSSGNGSWTDKNTLTPVYYPSDSDIITGSVVLTLTSKNPACPSVSDDMILSLTPFPVSDAGSDDVICEDIGKSLNDSYSANFSTMEWRTSGDGNFNDKTKLHPVYFPGINDINNGSVKLYLIATGKPPCNTSETDSITISIQKNPIVYAGPDTVIGERELFTAIGATAQNVNQVSWSTLGDGTFLNSSSIITTYIHGDNDLKNKGVKLIIRGTANSTCIKVVTDTILVLITPKPVADAGSDEKICEGSVVTISTALAEEYSEIWWTTKGTGVFENDSTLTPTYHPGDEDIANRTVILELHARGKDPLEDLVVSDSMVVNIIHNAFTDAILSDTACENMSYQIKDIVYKDVNKISWSTSGNGYFNETGGEYPIYNFSSDDRDKNTIYFYVEVTSIAPCVRVANDTMMINVYHEPEPSFDIDNPEGCAPLKVRFTNTSAGEELTYYWNFGNGIESYNEDPGEMVFQQGRLADTIYTVTLTTTNRCSSHSTSKNVIVKPVPIADFGMDVRWGCSPKEIHFFNVTRGLADTYQWKWGDGKDNSSEENPGSHIF
jgi:PKD repeat protein